MLNIFTRSADTKPKPEAGPTVAQTSLAPDRAAGMDESIPTPEVLEGNENSDWALWEDSVWAQDSQMQSLTPSARIYKKEEAAPSQYEEPIDIFSSVSRKDP